MEPDNATLYQRLGFAEHLAGDLLRAIDDLEHSLQLNPASGETYFALGNVWYDLEVLEQARACYSQALALDSTAAKYHFQLGMVFFKTDQPDSAPSPPSPQLKRYSTECPALQSAPPLL